MAIKKQLENVNKDEVKLYEQLGDLFSKLKLFAPALKYYQMLQVLVLFVFDKLLSLLSSVLFQ